jgi:hypothetical protein
MSLLMTRACWPTLQLNTHWNFFYGKDLGSGLPPAYSFKSRYHLNLTVPQKGLPKALRYNPPG